MAEVQITARDNFNDVLARAQSIEKEMQKISSANVTPKIDSGVLKGATKDIAQATKGLMELQKVTTRTNSKGELEVVTKLANAYGTVAKVVTNTKTHQSTVQWDQDFKKLNSTLDNTGKSADTAADGTKKVSDGVKQAGNEAEKAESKVSKFGSRLLSTLGNMALTAAVRTVRTAFRDALSEMKEVDKQLTNVNKVTNISEENLKALGATAYETASKYGVSASDFMASVYSFSKAGYEELSSDLAELSTKTMLVGDVTQDMADKFVLSVDKAWKFNGSVEQLSKVIDEADFVNNNYATSLEKITQGLPNAASVASMAGMSVEETMAAIGTITATTQETGTKAGTALRALILNILKDTTTEVEDGVKLTKENLESLDEVISAYASDTTKAKRAAGELINPMETLSELAQAYKENRITDADMFQIESALGGKLRTNQLDALLKNWDTYKEMLEGMGSAAGTAQAEVDVMLTSWESKAQILKNTWTDFVQKSLSSDFVKGAIDGLTALIKNLDNLGSALTKIGVVIGLVKLPSLAAGFASLTTAGKEAEGAMKGVATSASDAGRIVGRSFSAMGVAIAGLYVGSEIFIAKTKEMSRNAKETAESLVEESDTLGGLYAYYMQTNEAYESGAGSKAEYASATIALAEALGVEKREIFQNAEAYKELTIEAMRSNVKEAELAVSDAEQAILRLSTMTSKAIKSPIGSSNPVQNIISQYDDLVEKQNALRESGEQNSIEYILNARDIGILEEAIINYKDAVGEAEFANELLGDMLDDSVDKSEAFSSGMQKAKAAYKDFQDSIKSERGSGFKEDSNVFSQVSELFQSGMYGSEAYRSGLKYLFGAEAVEEFVRSEEGSWKKAGEIALNSFYSSAFEAGGDDFGSNLIYGIYDNIAESAKDGSKVIKKENGEIIASFKETEDGLTGYVRDYEALSGVLKEEFGLGLDEGVLRDMINGLGIFDDTLVYTRSDVQKIAESFEAWDDAAQSIDIASLVGKLSAADWSTEEIAEYVRSLQSLGDITFDGELIDPSNVESSVSKLLAFNEETRSAKEEYKSLQETAAEPTKTDMEVDYSDAEKATRAIDEAAQHWRNTTARATFTISAPSNTPGMGYAEGTDYAKGGKALVNEEGPEIIQYRDKAWIAGGGYPSIVDMPQGARVFTAEETAGIFNGSSSALGAINAYAVGAGSGAFSGVKRYNSSSSGGSSGGTTAVKTSTKSSGSSSSKSSGSTGSKKQSDAQKEKIDQLKDIVNLRKSELALLEAQKAPVRDQIDKQREIQDAIKNQIDYMVSIKASQEEINKLWTDWYKIESDIAKLQKDMLDDLSKAIDGEKDSLEEERDALIDSLQKQLDALDEEEDAEDKLLTLEEKRLKVQEAQAALANANAERTVRYYNAATGQWEWRANASSIKSAQESLDNAVKDLQDYEKQLALDKTKKDIQDQIDAIEQQYQEAIDAWEEIQKSMEEPAQTIAEALQKIADNFTPAMLDDLDKLNQKLAQFGYALDIAGLSPVKPYTGVYDDGGVLKGLGGIKATAADEMVIPPALTRKMLSPAATGTFKQRMNELSFMYGANRSLSGGRTYGIGTQNNGDTYQLGGITMTTEQAKSTTVYELARMSKNLRAYNAG